MANQTAWRTSAVAVVGLDDTVAESQRELQAIPHSVALLDR